MNSKTNITSIVERKDIRSHKVDTLTVLLINVAFCKYIFVL